jgi:hypothetical protein
MAYGGPGGLTTRVLPGVGDFSRFTSAPAASRGGGEDKRAGLAPNETGTSGLGHSSGDEVSGSR